MGIGLHLAREELAEAERLPGAHDDVLAVGRELRERAHLPRELRRAEEEVVEREADALRAERPDERLRHEEDAPRALGGDVQEHGEERVALCPAAVRRAGPLQDAGRPLEEEDR